MRSFISFIALLLAGGWAYFIYWGSVSPSAPATDLGGRLDFLGRPDLFVHAGAYALLAFCLRLWVGPIRLCRPFNVTLRYFMPVLVAGIYGSAIELVQRTIATRDTDPLDATADIIGAIIAVAIVGLWLQARKRRRTAED